jgi:hypothetical protein
MGQKEARRQMADGRWQEKEKGIEGKREYSVDL